MQTSVKEYTRSPRISRRRFLGCAHPDALTLVLPLRTNVQVKAEAEAAIRKIAEAIRDRHPEAAQEALGQLK